MGVRRGEKQRWMRKKKRNWEEGRKTGSDEPRGRTDSINQMMPM